MIRRNQTKRNVKRSSRAGVRFPTDRPTAAPLRRRLRPFHPKNATRADAPTRRRADARATKTASTISSPSRPRATRDARATTTTRRRGKMNDVDARDEARDGDGDDEEEEAARARTMTLARDARTRGAEREGDDAETQSRGKKRARRKRDDAGRRDARTTFGGFATLPTELVVKIMKELDGYSLAMATCACKDFEATGRENDELWLELLIKLEPRALMREDLMQNGSGKFRAFSYKELFMWRLHTLKGCAMMNTKAYAEMAARGDATRALSADASGPSSSELRSKIGHLGRLAVINQEQLFTCDPRPKGGLIYNVYDSGMNSFVPHTLLWSPRSELLACAFLVNGAESKTCHSKIILSAPKAVLTGQLKFARGDALTNTNAEVSTPRHGRHPYEAPPMNNIIALPHGLQCAHMAFAPCGTMLNILHKDRMESSLYTLDCAISITSLYGPSNGKSGTSPVPPPSEHVTRVASGTDSIRFAISPIDNNSLLMFGDQREIMLLRKQGIRGGAIPLSDRWPGTRAFDEVSSDDDSLYASDGFEREYEMPPDAVDVPRSLNHSLTSANSNAAHPACDTASEPLESAFQDDIHERATRDCQEVVSTPKMTWWQQLSRNILAGVKSATLGARGNEKPSTSAKRDEDSEHGALKRIKDSANSIDRSDWSCLKAGTWWSNIPNFRKLTDILVKEHAKQPLARLYTDETAKRIEWVPSKRGDVNGRGFWLLPSSIPERYDDDHDTAYYAFLVMVPVPSEKAIKERKIKPFISGDDDELFQNISECVITEISPAPAYAEPNIVARFLYAGRAGGRQVVWSTVDGLFVRCVDFNLDAEGDWMGPPTLGPMMQVIDFTSILNGANRWNKSYDEVSVRNYASWNGSRQVPVLSVVNEVLRYTIEVIQWSPSGERLLILMAVHLAYEEPVQAGEYYTVHQWICWDPPPVMSDDSEKALHRVPAGECHGVLSFGSRFIPSQTFRSECSEKMDNLSGGINLWSPEETAIAFGIQVPRVVPTHESSDYIVIQNFPRVNFDEIERRSLTGEAPPLQQDGSVASLPYHLNYVDSALEYVCEGTYCSWSPT